MLKKLFPTFLLFISSFSIAHASSARPTGGELEVKVQPSPNIAQQLQAGTIKAGTAVPMVVSFFYPFLGNDNAKAKAHVILDPLDSTLTNPQLKGIQGYENNAEYDAPTVYEMDLGTVKPAERVSLPVIWTSSGRFGASARVTVILKTPTRDFAGRAAYTVGINADKTIKPMHSMQIYRNQISTMKADVKTAAKAMVAGENAFAPFIPENHKKELSRDSDAFDKELVQ